MSGTHLLVCKTQKAKDILEREYLAIASMSRRGVAMEVGDALVARDILQEW